MRENEGMIEAEIFPDYEYAKKQGIEDMRAALQKIIDQYNLNAPAYKKVYRLKVRRQSLRKRLPERLKDIKNC